MEIFEGTTTVLCDAMDLKDDAGVEQLLNIAESVPVTDEDDPELQIWVQDVLKKAQGEGCPLRADIGNRP